MHPIRRYCEATQTTQTELARRVGLQRSALSEYIAGRSYPSPATAKRIVAATGGEISISELYGWEPERPAAG